jgi:hypothetical protein
MKSEHIQIRHGLQIRVSWECFKFSENFLRMSFPNAWDLSEDEDVQTAKSDIEAPVTSEVTLQVTMQVTMQVTPKSPLKSKPKLRPKLRPK